MADDWKNQLGATGAWEEPSSGVSDYVASLLARARAGWGDEGRRLLTLGRAGSKEQARDMLGVGHFVDAYDASQEGRYLPAAGNAALGVADLAGPARSKAIPALDEALRAWSAATGARPAQVAAKLAELTTKRMKPSGPAADRRVSAAERTVPWPEVPIASGSPQRAQTMLDVADRTWPGNLLAGTVAAGGASGIPGAVIGDAKDALGGPVAAYDQDLRDYREPEKAYRLDDPHIKKIHDDMTTTNNVLAAHIGAGAGLAAATPPLARLGWRGASGIGMGVAGLGAEVAAANPMAGLGLMALGLAPMALPFLPAAATGFGAFKAAADTGSLRERALNLKAILDGYGRIGQNRLGQDAQASHDREGY